MNVPMKWLKEYVDIDCDIMTYIDDMTMSGSKVEGYEKLGEEISLVVVGKILEITKHPDAEKLIVTQVDVGTEVLQIVTGADNVKVGDYIPVAKHGSTLPGGIKIKNGKLRGVESRGMLCSIDELGLNKEDYENAPEHGIFIFDEPHELGMDVKSIFGLDDIVVEYEITSNRPDCLSVIGIAREAAATFDKELHLPNLGFPEIAGNPSGYAKVTIENPELCARYMGRIVQNVKIGPSPKWLKQKLTAAGLRPINNMVDITNFIMMEMGQPMHAFDVETLEGKEIIVRTAKEGEKIQTLDNEERSLTEGMLVIADAKQPVAIAGVIGGNLTKINDETKVVLFEAANFDGMSIRHTSKKLGLRTDASSKFEKHLDPNNIEMAMNRACQLVTMIGAGDVVEGIIDVYPRKREEKVIGYSVERINELLGTEIREAEMVNYFAKLSFRVNQEKKEVTVPTFRADVEGLADLAEEVARLYGYDKIPVTNTMTTPTAGKKNFKQKIEDITKIVMEDCGLSECVTYSFESPKVFTRLCLTDKDPLRNAATILNPLGEDFSIMRTSTMNGMLTALSTNYNRRNEKVRLYEIGKVYLPKSLPVTELPDELQKLTVGLYGGCDYYDCKGIVETLIDKLGFIDRISYSPVIDCSFLHPGRKAIVYLDGTKELGYIGEIHPNVADNYSIEEKTYVAVLDFASLTEAASLDHHYTSVPKYPAVNRDLAFLVKEEILVQEIETVIKKYAGKLLEGIQLFDVYKGAQIEAGYKSIAYSLMLRAKDHTLEENEVTKVMEKVLKGLETELGVVLRK